MEHTAARFDLTLLLEETVHGLAGSLEYNDSLFERERVGQLVEDFQCVLEALVENPALRIWDIPLRSAALSLPPPVQEQEPDDLPDLLDLFAAQVARTPRAIAVRCDAEQLTYEELEQRAHQLAYVLRQLDIESGSCIGLALERSLEVVVGLLAILEVGGVYRLLEPTSLAQVATQDDGKASVRLIITRQRFLPPEEERTVHSICLETLTSSPTGVTPVAVTTQQNSGSLAAHTGRSARDGAHRTRQSAELLSFLSFCRQRGLYGEDTRASAWWALTSEIFLYELLLPLLSGGSVSIVPEQIRLDGRAYSSWLAEQRITSAYLPSFVLPDIMLQLRQGQTFSLERILLINQMSAEQQLRELLRLLPHARIVNGYGVPGLAWATCYEVERSTVPGRCTPIGRAIAPNRVYLLDQAMHPVPPGVVGALYLGGPNVNPMDHECASEDEKRFLPDPFGNPGTWLYQTGDFARMRLDGNLELAGCEREWAELRGMRVWPAEVASVVTLCPGVQDAVVVVREDEEGHSILVAYIRAEPGTEQSSLRKTLVAFARDHLPAHMVPSFFVVLAQWPLDLNGGVLHDALPPPTSEQVSAVADPQSKLEREIAAIWRKVLNIDTVSIYDNFFDRGGHSLLLIKLQSELQTTLNVQLSIVDLFKCPTISALAGFIQRDHPVLPTQSDVQQLQGRVTKQKDAIQRQKILSQERRINRGTD